MPYRLATRLTKAPKDSPLTFCEPTFATQEECRRYEARLQRLFPGMLAYSAIHYSTGAVTAVFPKGCQKFRWLSPEEPTCPTPPPSSP